MNKKKLNFLLQNCHLNCKIVFIDKAISGVDEAILIQKIKFKKKTVSIVVNDNW